MIGLIPIMWSNGVGADVMKPLAAPMIGGLITSTFLSLLVIPVVFTFVDDGVQKLHRGLARLHHAHGPPGDTPATGSRAAERGASDAH